MLKEFIEKLKTALTIISVKGFSAQLSILAVNRLPGDLPDKEFSIMTKQMGDKTLEVTLHHVEDSDQVVLGFGVQLS